MSNYLTGSEWRRWDLHVHTASSYDAYKGTDSDDLLSQALIANNISAVAITDHFIIDSKRILHLRELAPSITFFPGVELRTDKGASNIHVILIFSDTTNLDDLCEDFNVFKRNSSVNPNDNEKIYWDFNKIIDFANIHNAIVSIHAGSKDKGVDDKISNALPINEAIKEDFAKNVDLYEMGKVKDLSDYKKYVFPSIGKFPMIICSDNHNPNNYIVKEPLWIKANPTFEGLKQITISPEDRVYIGSKPPKLSSFNNNKTKYIKNIEIKKKSDAKNEEIWFDNKVNFNIGLTAIIGNKGSGKSALSDILGLTCNSKNINNSASFLTKNKFLKTPKKYAADYTTEITWQDGHSNICNSLDLSVDLTGVSYAQYLPQRFIEDTCNRLDNEFQKKVNDVIFSYIDTPDRLDTKSLHELEDKKCHAINAKIQNIRISIEGCNKKIINLENKMKKSYIDKIDNNLNSLKDELTRVKAGKPLEIKAPVYSTDNEYAKEIIRIDELIEKNNKELLTINNELKNINNSLLDLNNFQKRIDNFKLECETIKSDYDKIIDKYQLNINNTFINFNINTLGIIDKTSELLKKKEDLEKMVLSENFNSSNMDFSNKDNVDMQLKQTLNIKDKISILNKYKDTLKNHITEEEKMYQAYKENLKKWNEKITELQNGSNSFLGIEYYEKEKEYLQNNLISDLQDLYNERLEYTEQIFNCIEEKKLINNEIYEPVKEKLNTLLHDIDNRIEFNVDIIINTDFINQFLVNINQNIKSSYRGKKEGFEFINNKICDIDTYNKTNVSDFVSYLYKGLFIDIDEKQENYDRIDKVVNNREDIYNYLFGLKYFDINYTLKMDDKTLEQLSPGEKGIVLLIFYLALEKSNCPLIIDQPEDNLDNESVFKNLVPCIKRAKENRQVIIVTHNPNIAVACDAEEIIYCQIDKTKKEIRYTSGAIENPIINDNVVNILEGTMPAFALRSQKYN